MESWCEQYFRLGKKVKGKATQSEHLEQAARQLGKSSAKELQEDYLDSVFPDLMQHLWEAFLELHSCRTMGFSAPNPISLSDIKNWSEISGVNLTPWEVSVIKSVDEIWLSQQGDSGG